MKLVLLPLAFCSLAILSPLPARAQWAEPPGFDQVREFVEQAEMVTVAHLVPRDSIRADSLDRRFVVLSSRATSIAMGDDGWRRQVVNALFSRRAAFTPMSACAACWPCEPGEQEVALVTFVRGEFTMEVLLHFRERCASFLVEQGSAGRMDFTPAAQIIHGLVEDALAADPSHVRSSLPPAGRPPMTNLGRYVYVDTLPEPIDKVPPLYPSESREQGAHGTVLVQALVGKDGLVKDTRVAWSIPTLDEAAVNAVRQWRFKPGTSKGDPVAVWVAIPVRFSLR